ncbi:MAG: 50S ribosomal protein L22 [Myxococcota bacterium]
MSAKNKHISKRKRIKEDRATYPRASLNNVRIAPRKARIIANMIRGKDVEEALSLLAFTNKRAAKLIKKLLMSATYNAEEYFDFEPEESYIKTIYVDEGPVMKWRRPRARGRAFRINKRTSHITIKLDLRENE